MLPFEEDLDVAKTHVQAPTSVVFLCGGQCSNLGDWPPLSLRDAFRKINDNPAMTGRHLFQAEDVGILDIFDEYYSDLLKFETHLAQITELIILFCESEGSLAELGAFSMAHEIASRLLVIIREKYWNNDSFIKLGPLRSLEKTYGEKSIYVINDLDIGWRERSGKDIKIDVFKNRLQEPIRSRLVEARDPTTFKKEREGHVIKLIVGLVQEYGALTVEEIVGLLSRVGVEETTRVVASYLLCAATVDWVVKKRKGSSTYYIAFDLKDAATNIFSDRVVVKNKVRRRFDIREHWKQTDDLRYVGIQEVLRGKAP